MKKIKYIHPRVCLCRNCSGTGKVTVYTDYDILKMRPETATCKVCNGSGRVTISGQVVTNIIPYIENETD